MKKNRWLVPGLLTSLLLAIGLLWLSPIRNLLGRIIRRKPAGRPDDAQEPDSSSGLMREGERVDAEKVHIPAEKKSYLSTIYGKALDARSAHPILGDTFADEAVRRIDFDFEKLAVGGDAAITLPMRAKHLDGWTREFLTVHPNSTVLHLGCGLDTRVFRIDPPVTVHWYDVDLADVIDLRKRLYPERPGYETIPTPVADLHWLDGIPGDRPVLVVAEGLVQYLPEHDRGALLNRITEQFPNGEIIFDAYSRLTVRLLSLAMKVARAGVSLYGGIDDGREIEQQVPRLRLVSAVSFLTLPEMVPLLLHSGIQAALYRRMERWDWYRRSMQHFRYEF